MIYKLCILAAGPSRRIGDFSDHIHKAILPVNMKGVISYVIEQMPADVEIVVAVGHRKDTVIDYLHIAYPDRKITFVEIERYFGEGTGPGRSLLECKDHLQCPFILATADTIVLEPVPAPTENWFGIAPLDKDPERFCTVKTKDGKVVQIDDKIKTDNKFAFIGLAGVRNYQEFFRALEKNDQIINGEIQVSNGFTELLPLGLSAKQFTWYDTGTLEGYQQANRHFIKGDAFDFSKEDEFLYFVNNKVIKFFADHKIAQNRVRRTYSLHGICPPISGAMRNFYSYEMIPGCTVYEALTGEIAQQFFDWAQERLWKPKQLTTEQQKAFDHACEKFYKDKTLERIRKFYNKTGIPDTDRTVNGKSVPPLGQLLDRIDWSTLTKGVPSPFHGDLQFDNVLIKQSAPGETAEFVLLDWRQDFAGLIEYGDLYYDLAKLYGGLIINYRLIKKNAFSCDVNGNDVRYNLMTTPEMDDARARFENFVDEKGYDLDKIRTITSLIFLNMSPLHNAPFDILLYHLGSSMLAETLGTEIVLEDRKERPLLCIGPMSKQVVDTVIDFSHARNVPVCLIASRSQVETAALGGGYANNWSTEDFAAYVRDRLKEKPANVLICRDHGGPWLGADEKTLAEKHAMMAAKASFEADIASGFNMIHIDTSVNPGGFDMQASLRRSFELLQFCEEKAKQYGTSVRYEIGTEDADGGIVEPELFEEYLSKIVAFCDEHGISKPVFIVGKTGTWVRETHQAGIFDPKNTMHLLSIVKKYGVGIKEHNADYDSAENHRMRAKVGVTALNVAPEFGVIQTTTVLNFCKRKGRMDLHEKFIDLAYNSKKWKKWLKQPDVTTREQKAIIAGHYVFGTPEFKSIIEELGPEVEEDIRQAIWDRLDWYIKHLHGQPETEDLVVQRPKIADDAKKALLERFSNKSM